MTPSERRLAESDVVTPSATEQPSSRDGRASATADAPREGVTPERRQLAVDVLMLGAAIVAVILTAPAAEDPVESPVWLAALPLIVLALLGLRGRYGPRIGLRFLEGAGLIVGVTAVAVMAITVLRITLTGEDVPGSQPLREWLFCTAFLMAGHTALTVAEARARRRQGGGRPTLIIGTAGVSHRLVQRLLASPEIGLRPVGFLDATTRGIEERSRIPVLGGSSDLEQALREHRIEHVIFSFSAFPPEIEIEVLERLQRLGLPVSVVPRLFEALPERVAHERVGALQLVSIYPSISQERQLAVKHGSDRILAGLAILLLAPLLIAAAVGVLASVGRPLVFSQRRVGRDRREFDMLKFRTMHGGPDNEAALEAGWEAISEGLAPGGVEGVDRRTRFGSFLRRTSLDELPQLLNVLRGEMSIVGPRPERPEYVRAFEERVHRYGLRHRVRAGMTGWAQVHGLRGRTPLAERIEYDNYYIENWSLWLDAKILMLTVPAVLRGRSE